MTTVHVINSKNRHFYDSIMDQYFRIRRDVFVQERGWKDLEQEDGLEKDQFDDDHAVYLLAIDNGKVVGGSRFCPTLRPHMISEFFMRLVDRPLPRNNSTLEWSRYFVVRERRVGRTECRLLAAVQQYCLDEGVTSLTGLQDMWWVPRWLQLGFHVQPLGLPQEVEGEPTMAVRIHISESSLASVKKLGGLKSTKLTRHLLDTDREKISDAA